MNPHAARLTRLQRRDLNDALSIAADRGEVLLHGSSRCHRRHRERDLDLLIAAVDDE